MLMDTKDLNTIAVFYYVLAAFSALMGCFVILHFGAGLFLCFAPLESKTGDAWLARPFGAFFVLLSSAFMLYHWSLAVGFVLTARYMGRRQRLRFCTVMAALACTIRPIGTALGVLSLISLTKPEVKQLFDQDQESAP